MKNRNPKKHEFAIFTHQLPQYFEEFIEISGIKQINGLSKKHKFYPALDFYFQNKNLDWKKITIPPFIFALASDLGHFMILKSLIDFARKGKPVKALQKPDLIETYCVEAMIASHFVRRGYHVFWPSIFNADPPDIVVRDPNNKFTVDIEVKIKKQQGSVETMFDSFSKGLASLKRRRIASNMAVIAIHNSDDLSWQEWLSDEDILKRLTSRFKTEDFKIVSGVIFSGGFLINKDSVSTEYAIKFAAFRSHVAAHPLPYGFLTGSTEI